MQEEKGGPADAVPMVVEASDGFLLFCWCVSAGGARHGVRVGESHHLPHHYHVQLIPAQFSRACPGGLVVLLAELE